jgi:hypothetical protein
VLQSPWYFEIWCGNVRSRFSPKEIWFPLVDIACGSSYSWVFGNHRWKRSPRSSILVVYILVVLLGVSNLVVEISQVFFCVGLFSESWHLALYEGVRVIRCETLWLLVDSYHHTSPAKMYLPQRREVRDTSSPPPCGYSYHLLDWYNSYNCLSYFASCILYACACPYHIGSPPNCIV